MTPWPRERTGGEGGGCSTERAGWPDKRDECSKFTKPYSLQTEEARGGVSSREGGGS